jgi:hypothetical protein
MSNTFEPAPSEPEGNRKYGPPSASYCEFMGILWVIKHVRNMNYFAL